MRTYSTLVALVLLALASHAQLPGSGGPASDPTTPTDPPTPTDVPLDGASSLLLASGLAYGLKRLRRQRR